MEVDRWRRFVEQAKERGREARSAAEEAKLRQVNSDSWWDGHVVEVKVLSGTGLAPKDLDGTGDPYVRFGLVPLGFEEPNKKVLRASDTRWFKGACKSTDFIANSLEPKWSDNNVAQFTLAGDAEPFVRLEVWDHDMILRDDFMGVANLSVHRTVGVRETEELPLTSPSNHKGEVSGSILVEVELQSHEFCMARDLCQSFKFTRNLESIEEELSAHVEDCKVDTIIWILQLLEAEPWVGDEARIRMYRVLLNHLGHELSWAWMNEVLELLELDLAVHGPVLLRHMIQEGNDVAVAWLLENHALKDIDALATMPALKRSAAIRTWQACEEEQGRAQQRRSALRKTGYSNSQAPQSCEVDDTAVQARTLHPSSSSFTLAHYLAVDHVEGSPNLAASGRMSISTSTEKRPQPSPGIHLRVSLDSDSDSDSEPH